MLYVIVLVESYRKRGAMISIIKNNSKILIAALTVILAIAVVVVMEFTKPYAVYADGSKVEDPYVVKAGDKELFLVKDAETAEKVVKTVMDEYTPEGAQVNFITVDKKLSIEKKELARGEEPPQAMKKSEAVEYVLEENSTEEPLFSVTVNADTGSLQDYKAPATYEESADLYKGETKVKAAGTDGNQVVTNQVVSVNGAVLQNEVVDTTVVKEAISSIVYKGTKERTTSSYADYSGKVIGSGNGASIAAYALQFCGNPYVYGGTSLTNGADCSGFVYSVYRSFGINLPRVQPSTIGKGVSYSEAKAGDLIFYPGHVAIYIGGGKIVHASTPATGICVGNAQYNTILAVRRIVE